MLHITRKGLRRLIERRDAMEQTVIQANAETADLYHSAGDQWHDNPAWQQQEHTTNALANQLDELKGLVGMTRIFIDDLEFDGSVALGTTVSLRYLNTGKEKEWTFLGPAEGDAENGFVSSNAALAIALLGKNVGDECLVNSQRVLVLSVKPWEGLEPTPKEPIEDPE